TGHAFDNQTYTRAEVLAFAPPTPTISGTAQEGQTLTADATTNDADPTINYQWEESASASFTTFTSIGTNSATYVVQPSDVGSFIRVVASTNLSDNSQTATGTSSATAAVAPATPTLTAPTALTVTANSSIALNVSETPFAPSDPVSITIGG